MTRFARLAPMVLALVASACATGDDGISQTSFGPGGGVSMGGDAESSTGDAEDGSGEMPMPMPMTSSGGSADGTTGGGGDDEGNPLCCEIGPQAGCDSATTESCVCTSQPSCCQAVWSQECVDLAIACGDPYCADPSADSGDSGDSGEVELDCDVDFAFDPPNPAPGVAFTATFTDPVGLTWVGMTADGSGGTIEGEWGGVTGGGPFTWSYGYDGLDAGVWTFVFTYRDTENGPDVAHASCQKQF